MAVGAHDDVTAHRVQPVIAVQITTLDRAIVVKLYPRIAIDLCRHRRHTQDRHQSRQDHEGGDDAGGVATCQWATLQGEPPPYPAADGRNAPNEGDRLARIVKPVPATPVAIGRLPEVT